MLPYLPSQIDRDLSHVFAFLLPRSRVSDCAVCSVGYGRGVSNTCHSCDNPKGKLLMSAGVLFSGVAILVLFFAAVFLIGGLDAVIIVRQSVAQSMSKPRSKSKSTSVGRAPSNVWFVSRSSGVQELDRPKRRHRTEYSDGTVATALAFDWAPQRSAERNRDAAGRSSSRPRPSLSTRPGLDETDRDHTRPIGGGVIGVGVGAENSPSILPGPDDPAGPYTRSPGDIVRVGTESPSAHFRPDETEREVYTRPLDGGIGVGEDLPSNRLGSYVSGSAHTRTRGGIVRGGVEPTSRRCDLDVAERVYTLQPIVGTSAVGNAAVGTAVGLPDVSGIHDSYAGMRVNRRSQTSTAAGAGVGADVAAGTAADGARSNHDGTRKPKCCGLGGIIKRWASRLPFDKIKILVVVWQILTVFSGIAGVQFPASYANFLSWLNVVNLDIGQLFSASCVLPPVSFYARLLVATLTPFVFAAALVLTYRMALRRSGIGSAGVTARRDAWSRHAAAGLLLTFLVRRVWFWWDFFNSHATVGGAQHMVRVCF